MYCFQFCFTLSGSVSEAVVCVLQLPARRLLSIYLHILKRQKRKLEVFANHDSQNQAARKLHHGEWPSSNVSQSISTVFQECQYATFGYILTFSVRI